jgi:transglutaminase-like putative cysteine protease
MSKIRLLVVLIVTLIACNLPQSKATPTPAITPTAAPTETPTPEPVYSPAFGIDYRNPQQYLSQGDQTLISDLSVLDGLRSEEQSIEHLGTIYRWLKAEFEGYEGGGQTIGVVTVDQLLEERRLSGCNDHGLVFAAVARHLGYPAIMVITNSIAWMDQYQEGEAEGFVGHVFVEIYMKGKWVLIDSTNGWYVEEGYDPTNPVIPLKGNIAGTSEETFGFYVILKGIDHWALGIHSQNDLHQAMIEIATQLVLETIAYPEYTFEHFK